MNLRTEPGFLGTDASLLADLNLLAYVLLLLPLMAVGFYFARRKRFDPQHKLVMTGITILNWVLILFVMLSSFTDSVAPNIPDNLSDNTFLFPTIHLITGGLAQLLATYLVLRMWFEKQLPQWFMVKNIKLYMRLTLSLWVVTALLGVLIYVTWYGGTASAADDGDVPPPVSTEEATGDSDDIRVPLTTEEASDDDAESPAATEEASDDVPPPPPPPPAATEDANSDVPAPAATEDAG